MISTFAHAIVFLVIAVSAYWVLRRVFSARSVQRTTRSINAYRAALGQASVRNDLADPTWGIALRGKLRTGGETCEAHNRQPAAVSSLLHASRPFTFPAQHLETRRPKLLAVELADGQQLELCGEVKLLLGTNETWRRLPFVATPSQRDACSSFKIGRTGSLGIRTIEPDVDVVIFGAIEETRTEPQNYRSLPIERRVIAPRSHTQPENNSQAGVIGIAADRPGFTTGERWFVPQALVLSVGLTALVQVGIVFALESSVSRLSQEAARCTTDPEGSAANCQEFIDDAGLRILKHIPWTRAEALATERELHRRLNYQRLVDSVWLRGDSEARTEAALGYLQSGGKNYEVTQLGLWETINRLDPNDDTFFVMDRFDAALLSGDLSRALVIARLDRSDKWLANFISIFEPDRRNPRNGSDYFDLSRIEHSTTGWERQVESYRLAQQEPFYPRINTLRSRTHDSTSDTRPERIEQAARLVFQSIGSHPKPKNCGPENLELYHLEEEYCSLTPVQRAQESRRMAWKLWLEAARQWFDYGDWSRAAQAARQADRLSAPHDAWKTAPLYLTLNMPQDALAVLTVPGPNQKQYVQPSAFDEDPATTHDIGILTAYAFADLGRFDDALSVISRMDADDNSTEESTLETPDTTMFAAALTTLAHREPAAIGVVEFSHPVDEISMTLHASQLGKDGDAEAYLNAKTPYASWSSLGLRGYMMARARAARWRGDANAASVWLHRVQAINAQLSGKGTPTMFRAANL